MNKINVEIADTPELLAQGLMHRKTLDGGMLFKFPDIVMASFWGKNTYIPLDIAFIDGSGQITEIKDIIPMSTRIIHSSYPCQYALEVKAGFFKSKGIDIGTKVEYDDNERTLLFK